MATLISAARHLEKTKTAPKPNPILARIEYLSLHARDPVAMTLHAQALMLREQYAQALALIEEVMRVIHPVTPSRTPTDKEFPAGIRPPWRVYEEINRKMGDDAAAARAVEVAALEYQDPQALVSYARRLMQQGDLEKYEECMSKAAAAGNAEACNRLANFYFLTSLGHYPRRGEKDAPQSQLQPQQRQEQQQKTTVGNWISSLFARTLSLGDYLNLAREWYELACNYGSHDAALTLSLLLRLNGNLDLGRQYLEIAAQKPELVSAIRGYRVNWDKTELTMNVDLKRLAV